jgi:hypothetical protein
MSRRRQIDSPESALELFLDTITNTFGGVLFIALLVVILLNLTGAARQPAPTQAEEVIGLEARLSIAQDEARALRTRLAFQTRERDRMRDNTDEARQREHEQLQRDHDESARAIEAVQASAAAARAAAREAAQSRQAMERRLRELREEEASSGAGGVLRLRLPRFRRTDKVEVPVVLAGQRLALAARFDLGRPVGADPAQVLIDATAEVVAPRPGAGADLRDPISAAGAVDALVRPFAPETHFVTLAVWPDSYREAEMVRDRLIAMGFEFNLVLPEAGAGVSVGKAQAGVQ